MLASSAAPRSVHCRRTIEEAHLPFGDEVAAHGWCTGAVVPQVMVMAIAPHLARPGQDPVLVGDADLTLPLESVSHS